MSDKPNGNGTTPRDPAQRKLALKKAVRFFYDIQRLRLQTSGRLYRRPENVTIELHPDDLAVLEKRVGELEKQEKAALSDVKSFLAEDPFYVEILSDKSRYRGIGPTMAGVILAEFYFDREDTTSKAWSFAGLCPVAASRCKICHHVVEPAKDGAPGFRHVGKARGKECDILIGEVMTYASGRSMRPESGVKLPYNAFLKMKLVGVLGPVMLKCSSPWRKFYDDYKQRKQSAGWGTSDGHRHQAAIRYMIKMLILDIWREWRTFHQLPVRDPYAQEKLGHTHQSGTSRNNERPAPAEALPPEVEAEMAMVEA